MSETDALFANRIRTGILAWLSDRGEGDFTEVAGVMGLANNTLSSHLRRLEDAGYIDLQRGFLGRKPRTRIVMTARGRTAWLTYLDSFQDGRATNR